ncbi:MAG TPA: DMT family transporter [Ignavibacteria bacterium]|nr:DMT family transporter [Ignavibacteria bacterium]
MKKFLIVIYLTFAAGLTPVAAKYVTSEISPLSLAFFRFGIATLLLILFFKLKGITFRIDKKDIWFMAMLGALCIPINQFFFLVGISLSTSSNSGVMYAMTPMIAYLISIKMKKEKFGYVKLLTISLTIIGIVIIFWESLMQSLSQKSSLFLGNILLFFAVSSWAVYVTLSVKMIEKYGALKTSTIAFIFGMVLYIPVFLFDAHNFTLSKLTFWGVIGFIHLSVLVAFLSYFIYNYSAKFIKISTLTTLTNTSPIITIIFSYFLLKETFSVYFIVGAIITLVGVFLTQFIDRKPIKENIND